MPLESDTLIGTADYLLAPKRAYLAFPLLCAAEAKRDDFVQGRSQCLAEMAACRANNRQENHDVDVYGIVSSGQTWQFYRLDRAGMIWETEIYTTKFSAQTAGSVERNLCCLCGKCF